MLLLKQTGAVGAGAIIGAVTRFHADEVFVYFGLPGHWSILLINVLGSGVLGWLLATGPRWERWETYWRYFLTTGVLGGFTTTSAFALHTFVLNLNSGFSSAFWYVFLSIVMSGLTFSLAYFRIGRQS